MNIKSFYIQALGDLISPVAVYMRIRDEFPNSCLLESSDYRGVENSCSIIGLDPIAEFELVDDQIEIRVEGNIVNKIRLDAENNLADELQAFLRLFDLSYEKLDGIVETKEVLFSGLLGYLTYDAVQHFEDIKFKAEVDVERKIPTAKYTLFRYLVQINHFKSEMFIQENTFSDKDKRSQGEVLKGLKKLQNLITSKTISEAKFNATGVEESNFSDEEYMDVVVKCKKHIQRGDIFQIVPSRRFSQSFEGDDFQVYRTLRAINPSPYLFYFDCGNYKLFGSSPEALIVLKDGKANSYPIAGTYFRKGTPEDDEAGAKQLLQDEKENAEHVMLVDLARNDLSKLCHNVNVQKFKEVQIYSHVIHLVSKIEGILNKGVGAFELLKATFPHGTLSGAPKYRAMELIDEFEKGHRSHYAGAVGIVSFDGDLNHAIMIRSFLSKENRLHYQAGGGVVSDSVPETEMMEGKRKLMALKKAINIATQIID